MIAAVAFGFLPLAIWLTLLVARRGFWRLRERDTLPVAEPSRWPPVAAVVPARNEVAASTPVACNKKFPVPALVMVSDCPSASV